MQTLLDDKVEEASNQCGRPGKTIDLLLLLSRLDDFKGFFSVFFFFSVVFYGSFFRGFVGICVAFRVIWGPFHPLVCWAFVRKCLDDLSYRLLATGRPGCQASNV